MAALTATDWTVSVQQDRIHQKSRHIAATIQLPSAGTYPSNGIPMPAYTSFGFKRSVDRFIINGQTASDSKLWKWDPTNNTLRAFGTASGTGQGVEVATTVCFSDTPTFYVTAIGW